MEPEQKPEPKRPDTFDNLEFTYANNSRFETSVWDLKILFGQLEQHRGSAVIDWHTGVTIPWMQAKVFLYYMWVNLMFHEMGQTGPITVHSNVRPPLPPPPTDEEKKQNPKADDIHAAIATMHAQLFGK